MHEENIPVTIYHFLITVNVCASTPKTMRLRGPRCVTVTEKTERLITQIYSFSQFTLKDVPSFCNSVGTALT